MAKPMLCTACGNVSAPMSYTKGSLGVEILLWCFFILPGLIYTVWRLASRGDACPLCKSINLIPPDSPVAKTILKSTSGEEGAARAIRVANQAEADKRLGYMVMIGAVILAIVLMKACSG